MVAVVVAVLSVRLLVLPMVSVVQVDQYGDGPEPSVLCVGVVAQGRRGQPGGGIGGDGGDEAVVGVAHGLGGGGAPDLDLGQVAVPEALHQHPVHAVVQLGDQVVHAQVGLALELAHQRQASAGSDHHFEGAGLAVAKAVLAGVVDVEAVVRVLDHRHALAAPLERRDHALDELRLAGAGKAGETDDLHRATLRIL